MRSVLGLWFAVSIAFCGCHSFTGETENAADGADAFADALADARFRPLGHLDIEGSTRFRGDSPSAVTARLELLDSVMDYVDRIRPLVRTHSDWNARSDAILSIMNSSELTDAESWFVDQLGASMVLEQLAAEPVTKQRAEFVGEAAGRFVEVLISRKSPNSALIADGLSLTEGYWPAERIRRAALRAAAHASDYLDGCPTCEEGSGKLRDLTSGREYQIIAKGRARLLALAGA
ncbi:MAG: hypothetical protein R3282_08650 [Rhodothermales bacterium]|nr:hypothetical protein [Rhodothermales bacterium]